MIRVLGRLTSINVRKVVWALEELGEPFERTDWGLPFRDPREPEFLALNPNATVPVLIDADGTTMWESNAILVYLARTRGALLPAAGQDLASALQWLGWQGTELNPSWGYAVYALIRKLPGYDDPAEIAASIARWSAKMQILENELARGRPFIAGDGLTVADIALGLSIHRWYAVAADKPDFPAIGAYYDRLRARPAGQSCLGPQTP